MTVSNIELPLTDAPCTATGGNYYLQYYYATGYDNLAMGQQLLGSDDPPTAQQAMEQADETLRNSDSRFRGEQPYRTAAATVLRLCSAVDHHEGAAGPRLEVIENVIAIAAIVNSKLTEASDHGGKFSNGVYTRHVGFSSPQKRGFRVRPDKTPVHYLKRVNYEASHGSHAVIRSQRENSHPLHFGFLGGETLLTM